MATLRDRANKRMASFHRDFCFGSVGKRCLLGREWEEGGGDERRGVSWLSRYSR